MRKLAIFSAAFAAAVVAYICLWQDVRALWLAGICMALSVLGRSVGLRRCSLAALGLCMGILWCFVYRSVFLQPLQTMVGEEKTVAMQVTERPRETKYGAAVEGSVGRCGVIIYGDEALLEAEPGDQVTVTGRVEETGLLIRDDESLYLRSKGIALCVHADGEPEITAGTPTVAQRIRIWLQGRIETLYDGSAQALVCAVLTGDRSGLSYGQQNELSVAGLSHAVAASGMHVSILLMLISAICGGSPRLRALIGVPVVVQFAWMTGASPSVCRAAVMQILFLCAPLARREQDPCTTLAAAGLVLLLENPWSAASVSFQLSFAAVAGLFALSGPIQRKLLSLKKKPGPILRFVAGTVSASLSAIVFTLPLCLIYFRIISIAAPLTNLLSLWAITGIFTLGLLSCVAGPLSAVLAWAVTVLCDYVLWLCRWFSSFPFAAAYHLPLILWAIAAYVVLAIWLGVKRKLPFLWPMSGLTAAFLACILFSNWQYSKEPWRFTAMDVGQGQCLLLQIGDFSAAVDCGGSYPEEAGEELARLLHSAGVTRLDALILTHYDLDHSGGALQLMDRVPVDLLVLPDMEDPTGMSEEMQADAQKTVVVENLTEITVPNGKIRLYPAGTRENDSNNGVCILATAEEYDILITGDLDRFAEMRLLSAWQLPEVDLLVAGHHGSEDATAQILLDTVKPETVVISVGEDNAYGHPADETLTRIRAAGAQILRTDLQGTIIIEP